ncbi:MAG: nitroreductase [Litorilinea sp.]|nr:MAG: nitroreductase [Litorilinea sp.]GIV78173.1 MAG: nitroreductase [Litorilinea sp.]
MRQGTARSHKPRGFVRLILRLPVWLYRLHLGWILGGRFIMFTHIGRKSGKPRQTVVEVVRHDQAKGEYVVASGWGKKSDWFQNVLKTPQVTVDNGRYRRVATVSQLPLEQAAAELADYARRHPLAYRQLTKMMLGRELSAREVDCRTLAEVVPVVLFKIQATAG